MKLKTATLFAIVGVSMVLCLQAFSVYENIKLIGEHYDWILRSIVLSLLWTIAFALLLVFFVVLYKNQKK